MGAPAVNSNTPPSTPSTTAGAAGPTTADVKAAQDSAQADARALAIMQIHHETVMAIYNHMARSASRLPA